MFKNTNKDFPIEIVNGKMEQEAFEMEISGLLTVLLKDGRIMKRFIQQKIFLMFIIQN